MNIGEFLKEDLIWLNSQIETPTQVFKQISNKGVDLGYVNETFLNKIKEREENYPTGLQLEGYGVAIPHTDADSIREQFISIVIPENGVTFKRMDDVDKEVEAHAIFVLGLNSPDNQLNALQELMQMFQNGEVIENLRQANSKKEIIKYISDLSNKNKKEEFK